MIREATVLVGLAIMLMVSIIAWNVSMATVLQATRIVSIFADSDESIDTGRINGKIETKGVEFYADRVWV